MLTKKNLTEATDYLMGSCLTPECVLNTILERQYTELELDQFLVYLTEHEVVECENCGWWSYTGLEYVCDCGEEEEDE